MKAFAARHPVRFALLVALALVVIDGVLTLVIPRLVDDDRVLSVAWDVGQYALAVGLLTSLGWWRRTGFTKRPSARSLLLLLPLLILPALQVIGFKLATHNAVTIVVLVEAAIAAGFTEEALFRGVILRALESLGLLRAAALSAVLFGLVHVVNLVAGADALATADQIVSAAGLGFAFAAVVLVTGTIWPVIVLHTGMDVLGMLTAGEVINTARPEASALQIVLVDAIFTALFVGYGYWLLRRHGRRTAKQQATVRGATAGQVAGRATAGN